MRKANKSIVTPHLMFCNEAISFQNVETYKLDLQCNFFPSHSQKVGSMGNEIFYGDGLSMFQRLNHVYSGHD